MADEFDPDAFLKQTAPKEEGAFDPDTFLKETAPAERGVMQRAGEAVLEAGKSGWEAAKKMVSPPENMKDYLVPDTLRPGHITPYPVIPRSLKETGAGLASPLSVITAPIA